MIETDWASQQACKMTKKEPPTLDVELNFAISSWSIQAVVNLDIDRPKSKQPSTRHRIWHVWSYLNFVHLRRSLEHGYWRGSFSALPCEIKGLPANGVSYNTGGLLIALEPSGTISFSSKSGENVHRFTSRLHAALCRQVMRSLWHLVPCLSGRRDSSFQGKKLNSKCSQHNPESQL